MMNTKQSGRRLNRISYRNSSWYRRVKKDLKNSGTRATRVMLKVDLRNTLKDVE